MKKTTILTFVLFAFLFSPSVSAQVVVQRCDVKTGWTSAVTLSVDNTDKKEGHGSLKIEAQEGTSDWFAKSFSGTQTGITNTGYLSFWLYVSDASKLDGGQIEISSSRGPDDKEYNWPFGKDNVVDGWNLMQLQISDAEEIGGGADLDNINYFRISIFADLCNLYNSINAYCQHDKNIF